MARSNGRVRGRIQRIIERDGDRCVWCSAPLDPLTEATIDHAVPRAEHGSHRPENLLVACADCNSRRHSLPLQQWLRHCEKHGYDVRYDVVLAAVERMGRMPQKMRKLPVPLPVLAPASAVGGRS